MYEKRDDYYKCLQMIITNAQKPHLQDKPKSTQNEGFYNDCFAWIVKSYFMLQKHTLENPSSEDKFLIFQREVLNAIDKLIHLDAHATVGLCDAIFKSDHDQLI